MWAKGPGETLKDPSPLSGCLQLSSLPCSLASSITLKKQHHEPGRMEGNEDRTGVELEENTEASHS